MRPNPRQTYAQARCAVTIGLRRRTQAAEAAIAEAQAETEAIRADMRALRAEIRSERAALTAFIESPDWARDLLLLARARVRAEMLSLSGTRQSCGTCGSFGRGLYDGLLQAEIDALCAAHGLPAERALGEIDWPTRMGAMTRRGRVLRNDWLTPPKPKPCAASYRSHAEY